MNPPIIYGLIYNYDLSLLIKLSILISLNLSKSIGISYETYILRILFYYIYFNVYISKIYPYVSLLITQLLSYIRFATIPSSFIGIKYEGSIFSIVDF